MSHHLYTPELILVKFLLENEANICARISLLQSAHDMKGELTSLHDSVVLRTWTNTWLVFTNWAFFGSTTVLRLVKASATVFFSSFESRSASGSKCEIRREFWS